MLTNKDKQEKLAMARVFDPSGTIEAVLTELFKHEEKDWNTKQIREKIQVVAQKKD